MSKMYMQDKIDKLEKELEAKDNFISIMADEIEELNEEIDYTPYFCPITAAEDAKKLDEYDKLRAYIRDQLSVYKIDSLDHQLFHQELQNKMGMPMTIGGLYK